MTRKFLIAHLIFAMFISIDSIGQGNGGFFGADPSGASTILPPSPSAAALAKYGEYEVASNTGVPAINIPLHTVKSGSIEHPISLSYHASGNKLADEGSWVGLGWSLNAGGVITRTVIGIPDDMPSLGYIDGSGWISSSGTYDDTDYDNFKATVSEFRDSQPDIFYFNFDGYKGSFYLNKDPITNTVIARQVTQEPIDIFIDDTPFDIYGWEEVLAQINAPGPASYLDLEGFYITTPDGKRYGFNVIEYGDYTFRGPQYKSAWYLSYIFDPASNSKIEFSYQSHNLEKQVSFQNSIIYEDNAQGNIVPSQNQFTRSPSQIVFAQAKKLRTIEYPNGHIDFNMDNLNGVRESRLYSLDVYDQNDQIVIQIDFDNDQNYPVTSGTTTLNGARKRLDGISIDDQYYVFTYNDDYLFPEFNSPDRDHWGYFNDAGNSSAIPTFTVRDASGNVALGNGANRLPDADAMKIGILESITYPTGGKTKFEYEPNTFYYFDQPGGNKVEISITQSFLLETVDNSHTIQSSYSLPQPFILSGETTNTWEDIVWDQPVMLFVEFGTAESVNTGLPTEYNPNPWVRFGSEYINYSLDSVAQDEYGTYHGYEYNYDPIRNIYVENVSKDMGFGLPKTLTLQTGNRPGNHIKVDALLKGHYLAEEPVNDDGHMILGGLRVKSITNYDHDGAFVSATEYTYERSDGKSSAQLMYGQWNLFKDNASLYYSAYTLGGCVDPSDNGYSKFVMSDYSPGVGGLAVNYEKIQTFNVDESGNKINGGIETRYAVLPHFDAGLNYPHPPIIEYSWGNSQVLSKRFYSGTGLEKLIKKDSFVYELSPIQYDIPAVKIARNRGFYWDWNYNNYAQDEGAPFRYQSQQPKYDPQVGYWSDLAAVYGSQCGVYVPSLDEFSYFHYTLTSRRKDLIKSISIDYDETGLVELDLITDNEYSGAYKVGQNEFRLLRSKTVHTPTEIRRYEYTYPSDYRGGQTSFYNNLSEMHYAHLINKVIEKRVIEIDQSQNERLVGAQLVTFDYTQPFGYLPYEVFNLNLSSGIDYNSFTKSEDMMGMDVRYESADLVLTNYNFRIESKLDKSGVLSSFVWGYNNQYPVIKAENSSSNFRNIALDASLLPSGYSDFESLIGDMTNIASLNSKKLRWAEYNDNLRNASGNEDAMIYTYTYKPGVGITSETDPNNRTTYYHYDSENRLQKIVDNDGNTVQQFDYNYKP